MVKPMSEQDDDESRKIWREVTMGLRINDMDKATAAKCAIEQKQRDDVRIRKENNITWQTKVISRFEPFFTTNASQRVNENLILFFCSCSRKRKTVGGRT